MTVMIDGVAYLTVADAAGMLATTELKILMLLRQKRLTGGIFEGVWHVTAESAAGYDPAQCEPAIAPSCRASCKTSSCGCK